jgi:hypothetical protein
VNAFGDCHNRCSRFQNRTSAIIPAERPTLDFHPAFINPSPYLDEK